MTHFREQLSRLQPIDWSSCQWLGWQGKSPRGVVIEREGLVSPCLLVGIRQANGEGTYDYPISGDRWAVDHLPTGAIIGDGLTREAAEELGALVAQELETLDPAHGSSRWRVADHLSCVVLPWKHHRRKDFEEELG